MRQLVFALSALSVVFSADAALADKRVAFVVGNGAYKNVDPLPNPPIDAKAMASTLRNVGFEVIEGSNLTRDGMTERLLEFGRKAQGADVALFFYAGHGISVNNINYLLPIDANLKSEMDVKLGAAINVETTLEQTMGDAKVKLVFLDACRDNPFAAKIRSSGSATRSVAVSSGLAEMKSGEGTLIAFATSPGQTALDGKSGGNSPFTRALLNNITAPGAEIQQAMTKVRAQVQDETNKGQLPWGHTNLIGAVYLNPDIQTQVQVAAASPTATMPAAGSDVELEFWRSIKDSNRPEELNAYITMYPNGQFKPLALARIAALQEAGTAPRNAAPGTDKAVFTEQSNQLTEDKIGLNQAKRRDVQRRLNALGFDTKATGSFDAGTRGVITRWQAARGYPTSGYLNKAQHVALLAEPVTLAEEPVVAPAPKPVRRQVQQAYEEAPPVARRQPAPAAPAVDPALPGRFIGGVVGGFLNR
ncbi:peptidase [Rhodopseudomonas boonkerdii]|uniref:caspase family protein n=1 Tax=Rhodopseudomonas boonkerdii TaxID=475937 RepID=UPI001E65BD57|nr:caspase family protein [Rhodopseudomonas boonkerdii]UGV26781.1 peptidase [Rhodopseudomonas boonkerdii]